MGQDNLKFPKVDVGAHQPEQIWRDFEMFNIHINAHKQRWLKDVIDIIDAHRFEEDFCDLPNVDYVWKQPGMSAAPLGCGDEVNGVLPLSTIGNSDNEIAELVHQCECWKLVGCYPLYAELRFKLNDALNSDFWFGLVTGTSWFAPVPDDYVVFHKDDDDRNLDFANHLDGIGNDVDTGIDLANNTWYRLGIHWDGDGTVRYFVIEDGDFPQTILATGSATAFIVQDEVLALGFGVRAGEAERKTIYVDYIKCVQKRVIE